MKRLGYEKDDLRQRRKGDQGKVMAARRLRQETREEPEMDSQTVAHWQLDVCFQPPERRPRCSFDPDSVSIDTCLPGWTGGLKLRFGIPKGREKARAAAEKGRTSGMMRDVDKSVSGLPFLEVFVRCAEGIGGGKLITRESRQDKEFHFQNWFRERLSETGLNFEVGGRNSYPDFRLVATTDGFEVKGLAYPGREANYDCNSQVPSGNHNGRTIYYVFGRYPAEPDGDSCPVLDLVVCHGDFLNADHTYVHKNKSVKGFGSYGDIMIRDRKMYVAPTPLRR